MNKEVIKNLCDECEDEIESYHINYKDKDFSLCSHCTKKFVKWFMENNTQSNERIYRAFIRRENKEFER